MRDTKTKTAHRSSRVAWNITTMRATQIFTHMPAANVGSATARLGHMRVETSVVISRPLSERPKSKANSFSDFEKKMVSVKTADPSAPALTKSGLSYCSSLHGFISILEMTGAFVCHCWFGVPKSIDPFIPTFRKGRPSYVGLGRCCPSISLRILSTENDGCQHSSLDLFLRRQLAALCLHRHHNLRTLVCTKRRTLVGVEYGLCGICHVNYR